jgi:hypothetical protein
VALSLPELQGRLTAAIFEGHAPPEEICGGNFSAAERLQIYRRNTSATLTEALIACYPIVYSVVGDEFFNYSAEQYIQAFPPGSGNLRDFGAALAPFLASFTPAQSLPYLPDVARLEWARQLSYHAADPPALEVAALTAIAPTCLADYCFEPHPATQLVASDYPIFDIWQLHQSGESRTNVDLRVGRQQVRVFRHHLTVEVELLASSEYLWLRALADHATLGEATEVALIADASFELFQALQRHLAGCTWIGLAPSRPRADVDLT